MAWCVQDLSVYTDTGEQVRLIAIDDKILMCQKEGLKRQSLLVMA